MTLPRASITGGDSLTPPYGPWRYMLEVDAVNYDLDELAAFARRRPECSVINLASGINQVHPPRQLVSFIMHAAGDPLLWHDYDGPAGHVLGRAIVAACERAQGSPALPLGIENVIVTAGASVALGLAARGLRRGQADSADGSRAVIPVPTFPLAAACLADAGFGIVEVAAGEPGRWLPRVDELMSAAGTAGAGVVYVNTFNNPSGERYEEAELRRLVAWARESKVAILHDTVSSDVSRAEPIPHLPSIAHAEDYLDGIVTVGSISKSRAMPGIRVGWLIASRDLVRRLARLNEMLAPSSPSFAVPALLIDRMASAAAASADDGGAAGRPQDMVLTLAGEMAASYESALPGLARYLADSGRRLATTGSIPEVVRWRARLRDLLAQNMRVLTTEFSWLCEGVPAWRGDFNTFVRLPAPRGGSLELTHRLFREHGLQTLPGPAFGLDEAWWAGRGHHTRLTFALPTKEWIEGLGRLGQALRRP